MAVPYLLYLENTDDKWIKFGFNDIKRKYFLRNIIFTCIFCALFHHFFGSKIMGCKRQRSVSTVLLFLEEQLRIKREIPFNKMNKIFL